MKKKTIYCAIYYSTIVILSTMLLANVVSLFLNIDKLLWLRIVNSSLKFEIMAKQLYVASQRVL